MHCKKARYLIFLFVIFGSSGFHFSHSLTWEEVLLEGKERNPQIISALKSLQTAKLSYERSYTNFLPQFSVSAGWDDSGEEELSYGISGRLSLFSGFSDLNTVKQERVKFEMEKTRYKRTISDKIYDLKAAFAQLLKAQKMFSLSEEIMKRRKDNTELVKLRYEAGREDRGAYLRSEADALQAEYDFSKAKRNLKTQQSRLSKEMGRDEFEVISVSGTFKVIPPEEISSFHQLMEKTPDYIVSKYEVDSSIYSSKSTRANFYPQISMSGRTSGAGSRWPPELGRWSMGVSFSYPLFSGGKDIYNSKIAKINVSRAKENYRRTRQEILYELQQAYGDLIDGIYNVRVKEKYFEASIEQAKISKVKYVNGLISYSDWNMIENDFINSEKNLLNAELDVFTARASWKRVLGEVE